MKVCFRGFQMRNRLADIERPQFLESAAEQAERQREDKSGRLG